MKHSKSDATGQGSARVWLINEQTIGCHLSGYVTEELAREAMGKTKDLTRRQMLKGYRPQLLLDITDVTGQTSGARSAAKELGTFSLRKIAVFGGGRLLNMVAQYIARAGGMGGYTRLFRTEQAAKAWLRDASYGYRVREGTRTRTIVAVTLVILAGGSLLGWTVGGPGVDLITTTFKPMNPVGAVCFLLLAVALLSMRRGKLSVWGRVTAAGVAVVVTVVACSVLLDRWFGWHASLDRLLFTDQLETGTRTGLMAPMTAVCLLLVVIMIALILAGQRRFWQRHLFYALSLFILIPTLSSLVRYGFGVGITEGWLLPMSLGSTLCFVALTHGLQTVTVTTPMFERMRRSMRALWPAIGMCCVVLALTGVAWRQSKDAVGDRVEAQLLTHLDDVHDTVSSRTAAYVDALRSFKAFFESSDHVTVNEFHTYFVNTQLQGHYPGFRAISYIATVPAKDKAAFTSQVRKETGSLNAAYKTFSIHPDSTHSLLFPTLYAEPNGTANGFDLGTDAERNSTLMKAMISGEPVASGTINLNAAQGPGAPMLEGFFITVPVYRQNSTHADPVTTAERTARSQGFINAVFEDGQLFSDIFNGSITNNNDLRIVITNAVTGEMLYTLNPAVAKDQTAPRMTRKLLVAGQQWRIALYASPKFGQVGEEGVFPRLVLGGGLMLAVLASWLVLSLARRREQAMALADSMTEDLNNERNTAVSLQRKDEAILTSIGDGVFVIDPQGHITLFNPVAEDITGYSAQEVMGKHYKEVLKFQFEKTGQINESFIKRALGGRPASMKNHTLLLRKDGARVPVGDSAAPIRDRQGNIIGVIVVFRDVSKEYALDQAKTEFVSLASHQLRTPLTAISWNTELLLGGDAGKVGKEQRERLEEIQNGTKRMIDLVDSLLNVSRLDLDRLGNEPQPNALHELIDSMEQELAGSIEAKSLNIIKKIDKRAPLVHADPKLVRMIVQNLFSNAVKYTPAKGTVTVTLRSATSQDRHNARLGQEGPAVFMSIGDTGYGIPKAQQSKIFSKLFRADNVRVLDVEGTGLGLYIVQQVVDRFGGRVWFDSVEKVGTTFYVVIPSKTKVWKKKEPGVTVSTHDTIAIADKIGG